MIASTQLFAIANITYMNCKLLNMTASPITPSPHKEEQHMLIIETQSGTSLTTGVGMKDEEGMMSDRVEYGYG